MNTSSKRAALVFVVAVCLIGCGDGESDSTKAGSASPPVTLRIGTPDTPGAVSANQIEEFARQVDSLSDGRLVIQPAWAAAGGDPVDVDQVIARMVMTGELEMGLIPARAWDTEGVTSLRALHAPFLVTSESLLDEVVSSDLATQMLDGLGAVDVTGLALLPEGLRRIFVFGDDAEPSFDLRGKVIWAPRSETSYALYTSLGATTDNQDTEGRRRGVAAGTIHAQEGSFSVTAYLAAQAAASANVVLFPKVNSLVVNDDAYQALDDESREVLRQAAASTLEWTNSVEPSEAERAAIFCKSGRVVNVPEPQVAAMRESARPVYERLEEDEATRAMIERITAMKGEVAAEPVIEACQPPAPTPTTGVGSTDHQDAATDEFPDGVFRMELTVDVLREAGLDAMLASQYAGTWEMTFDNGTVAIEDVNAATGQAHTDEGVYCTAGDRVRLGLDHPEFGLDCGDFFSARWTVDGDHLRFTDLRTEADGLHLLASIFTSTPFTKVD